MTKAALPLRRLVITFIAAMRNARTLTVLHWALAVATLLAGGCTTFNHDWERAAESASLPGEMQGRWQGEWQSEATGHHGRLRCLVTRTTNDLYQARFHAKYQKILSFKYTVSLKAEQVGGLFNFTGHEDLGWLAGGVYHYEGHADATNFFSKYSSKYDHGTFQMTRP